MSLFIGMLAFDELAYAASVRVGVIAGSLVSITLGLTIFLSVYGRKPARG